MNEYVSQFSRDEKSLPGARLPWLKQLRKSAISAFGEMGFPTTKDEEWKYTNVAPIAKTSFIRSTNGKNLTSTNQFSPSLTLELKNAPQLVFVNGHFSEQLSTLPSTAGLEMGNLADLLEKKPNLLEPYLGRQ